MRVEVYLRDGERLPALLNRRGVAVKRVIDEAVVEEFKEADEVIGEFDRRSLELDRSRSFDVLRVQELYDKSAWADWTVNVEGLAAGINEDLDAVFSGP